MHVGLGTTVAAALGYTGRVGVGMAIGFVLATCFWTPPTSLATSETRGPSSSTTAPVTAAPTVAATGPDLSARPLVWFAPLPPMPTGPGRPFIGSVDFMDLFEPDADWDLAASRIGVFKLYGEWVAHHATDAQLRSAVQEIARRGMALAVELGPLDPPPACGEGVESFAGIDEGRLISRRIRQAGGTLQVIDLDEPYYFAHLYDGPNACHWSVEEVAAAVAGFCDAMRIEWPDLIVGDTEPLPVPVSADGLAGWFDVYETVGGEPFAFVHLDVDWTRTDWPALGVAVEEAGSSRGVPIGIIYNGGSATSDAQWLALAGRRVLAYEADARAQPDHVVFQSWMDKPDHVLPETDPSTFTSFVNRYLDDPDSLGELGAETGNLALNMPARASSAFEDSTPPRAVDGDPDTLWSAGTGPPAWIEVDLGAAQPVREVRLRVSQSPAGVTHHRVLCTSPGAALVVVAEVEGETADLDILTLELNAAVSCQIIRIETLESPSWVAWREIEVLGE